MKPSSKYSLSLCNTNNNSKKLKSFEMRHISEPYLTTSFITYDTKSNQMLEIWTCFLNYSFFNNLELVV